MGNCTLSRWSAGSEQKYLRGRWFLLGCDHALYEFWYCSSPRDNSVLWVYQLAENSFDLKSVWFLLSISLLSESWYCSEPLQMCQMPLLVTVVKYMMELSFTVHFFLARVSARKQEWCVDFNSTLQFFAEQFNSCVMAVFQKQENISGPSRR